MVVWEGSISSLVKNSYWSISPDDNTYIFAASLLISYCNFSYLTLSSISMIGFYISKRFLLKGEGLSNARVASITKKEYGLAVRFLERFIKSPKSIFDE